MKNKKIGNTLRSTAIIILIIGIFVISPPFRGTASYEAQQASQEAAPTRSGFLEGDLQPVDGLIGIDDILFKIETEIAQEFARPQPITEDDIYRLLNFDYLRTQFFVSDRNTRLLPSDVDVAAFINTDLRININCDAPRVLIFHTHSTEMFADSNPDNPMDGVLGLGAHLADILETRYGIPTLHDTTRYDIVDGVPMRAGAYERMEPYIRQILQDNPTIEVVIDLHRDGLPAGVPPMITYIDGQRAARIMFVNGLSRRYNNDGVLENISFLPNPFLRDNLNFSFQLQLAANRMYPGFTRRVYLKAFRYSLHMMPRTILLEVGAQNNTMEEAHNAIPHIAAVIAEVIL